MNIFKYFNVKLISFSVFYCFDQNRFTLGQVCHREKHDYFQPQYVDLKMKNEEILLLPIKLTNVFFDMSHNMQIAVGSINRTILIVLNCSNKFLMFEQFEQLKVVKY